MKSYEVLWMDRPVTLRRAETARVTALKPFDAVLLDPPRADAEAQAKVLAKSNVKTIIMVACDVASFVRDAVILLFSATLQNWVTPSAVSNNSFEPIMKTT
jgi:tRNA/tmRNA/rRNA uracil-C5-methylase (TrmA/RlmC/RlmD family)